jgi:fluoride ion exporter CrcB/FEX
VSHVEYNNGQTDKVSSVTIDEGSNIFQHEALQNVGRDISTNISRMTRVSLADGWDVGTDAKAMSDDLLLGLRDGFCGALSSFTSWNSSMVGLLQNGQIGEAIVGYTIGLQLPIVSYRFGQHMAVYFFMWRTRRETRTDERRGYGLRLEQHEHSLDIDEEDIPTAPAQSKKDGGEVTDPDQEAPSVRAIVTAVFILGIVAQISSLFFFVDPKQHQLALSLLFSPFGALARWRLSRYNVGRHRFPLGTFACNLSAVALSGSLGTILAGSPGPRERIVLVSFIAGFGGSLSSVAMFIVETLRGIDPLLFRYDGFLYAFSTIFWAMVIGLVSNSTADWAEQAAQSTPVN